VDARSAILSFEAESNKHDHSMSMKIESMQTIILGVVTVIFIFTNMQVRILTVTRHLVILTYEDMELEIALHGYWP